MNLFMLNDPLICLCFILVSSRQYYLFLFWISFLVLFVFVYLLISLLKPFSNVGHIKILQLRTYAFIFFVTCRLNFEAY